MQILKFLDLFFGAFINMILCIFIIKKIYNIKLNKSFKELYSYIFTLSFLVSIINYFIKYTFKSIFTFPLIVYGITKVFKTNYKKSIIYVLISYIYMLISEFIITIFIFIFNLNYYNWFINIYGSIFANIIVFIISCILLKIKILKISVDKKILISRKNLLLIILLILIICIFSYKNIISVNNMFDSIINIIMFIIFAILLLILYKENLNYSELIIKHNELIKFLEKYEKEIVEKRKIIHDFNNQLIIINGYIDNKKKLKEYIAEIIKEQRELKDNKFIKNIDKLPVGIKGLVYYKISQLNEKVSINLNIKNNLKKFEKIPSKYNKEILKIIGIILDNIIEAVEKENNKSIYIEMSLKQNQFILITKNYCSSNINIKEIKKCGYSTKGENRGYGLSLIQDLSKKYKKINFDIDFKNNQFINKLIVNI